MPRRGPGAPGRRRHVSERLRGRQEQALSSRMYLLRETGPTGFLLREDAPDGGDFRVFLGNPHVCNCATFLEGGELCKHICWVLLKKFKLPRTHESALQLGLVEGEISDLLRGIHRVQTPQQETIDETVRIEEDGYIEQKEIDSEDICPICQEGLLEKKLPVTFCRCTKCTEYHLCQECFPSRCHPPHPFTSREKRNQRWKSLEKGSDEIVKYADIRNEREEKMPHFQEKQGQVYTPKQVVKSLPLLLITKNSKLLAPGYQCRLCLKAFHLGQHTRLLPCSHKFHRKCIDSWLFYKCNSCPIDGQVIYNPLIWKDKAVSGHTHQSISNTNITHLSKQEELELFIPGTGLVLKQNRLGILPSITQHNSEKLNIPESPTDTHQDIAIDDLFSIKLDDSNSRKLIYEYKISQHFPRYLQDLPTGPFGKMSSQTFLPAIAHKNNMGPTGMETPHINEKYHTCQSQKMAKDCKHINHNPKKTSGARIREDKKRSDTLLPEDLNLITNWGTTKISLSKRYNNYMGKIRQKYSNLSRRPESHPLNIKSPELSFILEGVQL
ncbi:E3 ubiquitin-protein ligase ZSWIM2 isoform X2 [Mustela erminea]|uniref:E3 ubiquitin-protein ligase ZSWIM2 isoform X2 n=1 Tax=Mustela erminea TaxID=36723 RepID=UPI001386DA37|nr:E3 ubiquitin-protein ligase ZSWIM2 isoform X2 [Mustela erminea]